MKGEAVSINPDLLEKLEQAPIKVFIAAMLAAKDEDGKPADSMSIELGLRTGETIVITIARKKARPLDRGPGLS